jgi:3-deoxy-manno-octulosonate cytidylyltransferase (CMP-KDO synthetase)
MALPSISAGRRYHISGKSLRRVAGSYPFFRHIGMYAYRYDVLREITRLEPSSLETAESLEQNRWLENRYRIKVLETTDDTIAIDTPDDLKRIK